MTLRDMPPLAALLVAATLLAGCVTTGSSASSDDRRWINQCLRDNRDARVPQSVVRSYCTCMNDRMSSSETRSITQWERANPRAREACERRSGWR
jgi:hypothetical protein